MSDPQTSELPFDAVDQFRTDSVQLIELVTDHGTAPTVPACPGWDLGDLLWHVGHVWNRWGRVVAEGITTADQVPGLDGHERPSNDLLVDWVTAAHTSAVSALVDAPEAQEVWTWTGSNQPVAWVGRRLVHETAVHRWDASQAVRVPYEMSALVAADGIDEFLSWFAARRPNADAAPVAGTVHLHCTDTDGEWLITRLDADGIEFRREHAKGDVAVRGRADDLLLWLWRRADSGVEILGDASVAERFRAFPTL
jgi:uncharacterized protein (TIGR03083 family)